MDRQLGLVKVFILLIMFILALVVLSVESRADSLYVGGWSRHGSSHSSSGIKYNEVHYLVGYERGGYLVAGFVNSYNDNAVLIVKSYRLFESDSLSFDMAPGVVYGYGSCTGARDRDRKKLCPALVPKFALGNYKIKPVIVYLGGAVALTFEVDI